MFSSSGCFHFLCLYILHLTMMCLHVDFGIFFLLDVLWVSWICGIVSDINCGKLSEITAQIFLLEISLSLNNLLHWSIIHREEKTHVLNVQVNALTPREYICITKIQVMKKNSIIFFSLYCYGHFIFFLCGDHLTGLLHTFRYMFFSYPMYCISLKYIFRTAGHECVTSSKECQRIVHMVEPIYSFTQKPGALLSCLHIV